MEWGDKIKASYGDERLPVAELVRRNTPSGMLSGTLVRIELIIGFEAFNTRPYHCYETWCKGWLLTDERLKYSIKEETLHGAIERWLDELELIGEEVVRTIDV